MMRPILVLHRWLGIIVGLVMTIWCLSGFIMMYVDYPRLTPAEQLQGLAPLQWPARLNPQEIDLPGDALITAARVEMVAGRPVMRIIPQTGPEHATTQMRAIPTAFDLVSGKPVEGISETGLASIARTFGAHNNIAGGVRAISEAGIDQWTVQAYRRNAPLYRADYADSRNTQIYISGKTGEVIQDTTRFERFWGWLGAVPHWLYPTILRQNGALWTQIVIWTSAIGCFLTLTGMWIGIVRLRRKRDGSFGSPYRGLWWWHHVFGLVFGILTLTWVGSGVLSMNPWGALASEAGFVERTRLAGPLRWKDVSAALTQLHRAPEGTVRLETAPLGGRLFLSAITADGAASRLDSNGQLSPLNKSELSAALAWAPGVGSLTLLQEEDTYYYAHKEVAKLPVWRVILSDREQTRLYIDAETGGLLQAYDSNGRIYRWVTHGLHSFDLPGLRRRPIWDLVVVPLLILVTLICATGTWMGINKVRRDLRRSRKHRRHRAGRGVSVGASGVGCRGIR